MKEQELLNGGRVSYHSRKADLSVHRDKCGKDHGFYDGREGADL